MRLISKERACAAPAGQFVYYNTFYTRATGLTKMATRAVETRSDLIDVWERAFSEDNGRTWSVWEPVEHLWRTPEGVKRLWPMPGVPDPCRDVLVAVAIEGTLPADDPLDGMRHYYLRYRVSGDGGRTWPVDEQIIQRGDYTTEHPCEGVWVGRNSLMIGDLPSRPLWTRDGRVLVPAVSTPIGPDGGYCNPGGGLSYHDAVIVIGTRADDLHLSWEVSERVVGDPERSTRGCDEPTLAEMPDGRLLMVIRGSNDVKPHLPGYKWFSVSEDGGYHWSRPEPWRYDTGEAFFSPASCSQLLRHSNGRLYWLGNIAPGNPIGNSPRYPFVIGEVNQGSLLLIRDSVTVIDDRGPDDEPALMLSNFMAHEDRETGEIVLHMSRSQVSVWTADPYVYRIAAEG